MVRIGERLTVAGHVRRAPRPGRVALESSTGNGWHVMASTALRRHGRFAVHWLVPNAMKPGPLKLRLILRRRSRLLAATPPRESAVGSSSGGSSPGAGCNSPAPPGTVPAGDGWIVGGLYTEGGRPPGTPRCAGAPYTVTATNLAGKVVTSQTVAADDSYTLVVPAGSYTLASGACRATATVAAGQQSNADVYCRFP